MAACSSPAGQGHGHCLLSTLLSVLTALRPAPSAPSLRRRELVDLGNSPFPWKPHVLSPCSRSRYHVLLDSSQAVQEGDSAHSLAELLAARRPQLASRVSVPYGERPLTPGAARADAVDPAPCTWKVCLQSTWCVSGPSVLGRLLQIVDTCLL